MNRLEVLELIHEIYQKMKTEVHIGDDGYWKFEDWVEYFIRKEKEEKIN